MLYKLKNIGSKTRYNLLRENNNMEEDEWREKVHNLKNLTEKYKALALSEEPSEESDGGGSDYYE
jgi:hypothetical protein